LREIDELRDHASAEYLEESLESGNGSTLAALLEREKQKEVGGGVIVLGLVPVKMLNSQSDARLNLRR